MSQCDNHECDTECTIRCPVRRRGEYLFLCYECYMKWKEQENADYPIQKQRR